MYFPKLGEINKCQHILMKLSTQSWLPKNITFNNKGKYKYIYGEKQSLQAKDLYLRNLQEVILQEKENDDRNLLRCTKK